MGSQEVLEQAFGILMIIRPIGEKIGLLEWGEFLHCNMVKLCETRKSLLLASTHCAALSSRGVGGAYPEQEVPTLERGYLPWRVGTYLGEGVPTLAGGYLHWTGNEQ